MYPTTTMPTAPQWPGQGRHIRLHVTVVCSDSGIDVVMATRLLRRVLTLPDLTMSQPIQHDTCMSSYRHPCNKANTPNTGDAASPPPPPPPPNQQVGVSQADLDESCVRELMHDMRVLQRASTVVADAALRSQTRLELNSASVSLTPLPAPQASRKLRKGGIREGSASGRGKRSAGEDGAEEDARVVDARGHLPGSEFVLVPVPSDWCDEGLVMPNVQDAGKGCNNTPTGRHEAKASTTPTSRTTIGGGGGSSSNSSSACPTDIDFDNGATPRVTRNTTRRVPVLFVYELMDQASLLDALHAEHAPPAGPSASPVASHVRHRFLATVAKAIYDRRRSHRRDKSVSTSDSPGTEADATNALPCATGAPTHPSMPCSAGAPSMSRCGTAPACGEVHPHVLSEAHGCYATRRHCGRDVVEDEDDACDDTTVMVVWAVRDVRLMQAFVSAMALERMSAPVWDEEEQEVVGGDGRVRHANATGASRTTAKSLPEANNHSNKGDAGWSSTNDDSESHSDTLRGNANDKDRHASKLNSNRSGNMSNLTRATDDTLHPFYGDAAAMTGIRDLQSHMHTPDLRLVIYLNTPSYNESHGASASNATWEAAATTAQGWLQSVLSVYARSVCGDERPSQDNEDGNRAGSVPNSNSNNSDGAVSGRPNHNNNNGNDRASINGQRSRRPETGPLNNSPVTESARHADRGIAATYRRSSPTQASNNARHSAARSSAYSNNNSNDTSSNSVGSSTCSTSMSEWQHHTSTLAKSQPHVRRLIASSVALSPVDVSYVVSHSFAHILAQHRRWCVARSRLTRQCEQTLLPRWAAGVRLDRDDVLARLPELLLLRTSEYGQDAEHAKAVLSEDANVREAARHLYLWRQQQQQELLLHDESSSELARLQRLSALLCLDFGFVEAAIPLVMSYRAQQQQQRQQQRQKQQLQQRQEQEQHQDEQPHQQLPVQQKQQREAVARTMSGRGYSSKNRKVRSKNRAAAAAAAGGAGGVRQLSRRTDTTRSGEHGLRTLSDLLNAVVSALPELLARRSGDTNDVMPSVHETDIVSLSSSCSTGPYSSVAHAPAPRDATDSTHTTPAANSMESDSAKARGKNDTVAMKRNTVTGSRERAEWARRVRMSESYAPVWDIFSLTVPDDLFPHDAQQTAEKDNDDDGNNSNRDHLEAKCVKTAHATSSAASASGEFVALIEALRTRVIPTMRVWLSTVAAYHAWLRCAAHRSNMRSVQSPAMRIPICDVGDVVNHYINDAHTMDAHDNDYGPCIGPHGSRARDSIEHSSRNDGGESTCEEEMNRDRLLHRHPDEVHVRSRASNVMCIRRVSQDVPSFDAATAPRACCVGPTMHRAVFCPGSLPSRYYDELRRQGGLRCGRDGVSLLPCVSALIAAAAWAAAPSDSTVATTQQQQQQEQQQQRSVRVAMRTMRMRDRQRSSSARDEDKSCRDAQTNNASPRMALRSYRAVLTAAAEAAAPSRRSSRLPAEGDTANGYESSVDEGNTLEDAPALHDCIARLYRTFASSDSAATAPEVAHFLDEIPCSPPRVRAQARRRFRHRYARHVWQNMARCIASPLDGRAHGEDCHVNSCPLVQQQGCADDDDDDDDGDETMGRGGGEFSAVGVREAVLQRAVLTAAAHVSGFIAAAAATAASASSTATRGQHTRRHHRRRPSKEGDDTVHPFPTRARAELQGGTDAEMDGLTQLLHVAQTAHVVTAGSSREWMGAHALRTRALRLAQRLDYSLCVLQRLPWLGHEGGSSHACRGDATDSNARTIGVGVPWPRPRGELCVMGIHTPHRRQRERRWVYPVWGLPSLGEWVSGWCDVARGRRHTTRSHVHPGEGAFARWWDRYLTHPTPMRSAHWTAWTTRGSSSSSSSSASSAPLVDALRLDALRCVVETERWVYPHDAALLQLRTRSTENSCRYVAQTEVMATLHCAWSGHTSEASSVANDVNSNNGNTNHVDHSDSHDVNNDSIECNNNDNNNNNNNNTNDYSNNNSNRDNKNNNTDSVHDNNSEDNTIKDYSTTHNNTHEHAAIDTMSSQDADHAVAYAVVRFDDGAMLTCSANSATCVDRRTASCRAHAPRACRPGSDPTARATVTPTARNTSPHTRGVPGERCRAPFAAPSPTRDAAAAAAAAEDGVGVEARGGRPPAALPALATQPIQLTFSLPACGVHLTSGGDDTGADDAQDVLQIRLRHPYSPPSGLGDGRRRRTVAAEPPNPPAPCVLHAVHRYAGARSVLVCSVEQERRRTIHLRRGIVTIHFASGAVQQLYPSGATRVWWRCGRPAQSNQPTRGRGAGASRASGEVRGGGDDDDDDTEEWPDDWWDESGRGVVQVCETWTAASGRQFVRARVMGGGGGGGAGVCSPPGVQPHRAAVPPTHDDPTSRTRPPCADEKANTERARRRRAEGGAAYWTAPVRLPAPVPSGDSTRSSPALGSLVASAYTMDDAGYRCAIHSRADGVCVVTHRHTTVKDDGLVETMDDDTGDRTMDKAMNDRMDRTIHDRPDTSVVRVAVHANGTRIVTYVTPPSHRPGSGDSDDSDGPWAPSLQPRVRAVHDAVLSHRPAAHREHTRQVRWVIDTPLRCAGAPRDGGTANEVHTGGPAWLRVILLGSNNDDDDDDDDRVCRRPACEAATAMAAAFHVSFPDGTTLRRRRRRDASPPRSLTAAADRPPTPPCNRPARRGDAAGDTTWLETTLQRPSDTTVRLWHDRALLVLEPAASRALCRDVPAFRAILANCPVMDLRHGAMRLVDAKRHVTVVRGLYAMPRGRGGERRRTTTISSTPPGPDAGDTRLGDAGTIEPHDGVPGSQEHGPMMTITPQPVSWSRLLRALTPATYAAHRRPRRAHHSLADDANTATRHGKDATPPTRDSITDRLRRVAFPIIAHHGLLRSDVLHRLDATSAAATATRPDRIDAMLLAIQPDGQCGWQYHRVCLENDAPSTERMHPGDESAREHHESKTCRPLSMAWTKTTCSASTRGPSTRTMKHKAQSDDPLSRLSQTETVNWLPPTMQPPRRWHWRHTPDGVTENTWQGQEKTRQEYKHNHECSQTQHRTTTSNSAKMTSKHKATDDDYEAHCPHDHTDEADCIFHDNLSASQCRAIIDDEIANREGRARILREHAQLWRKT